MKTHRNLFVVCGILFLLGQTEVWAQEKLKVVTTLPVLQNIAEEIGGDLVSAQSLADPRQDPHFVEPRPTLMKKAREADVFIEIGLQLELWAQKVVDGSGNSKIQLGRPGRIIASQGVTTLELPTVVSREYGDVHPYGNPHIWLDPINVKKIAENIAAGLSKIDLPHAQLYASRLADFSARIDEALFGKELLQEVGEHKLTRLAMSGDLWSFIRERGLEDKLGGWLKKGQKLRGKKIVTFHKTWIYFATRFGLTVPIEIEDKPGIAPTAKHRDRVIDLIREEKVPLIVMSNFYSQAAADYIAAQTGAKVVKVYIDLPGSEGIDSYFSFMDYLINSLTSELEG